MIRLDEHALREDKAYWEAYRLAKAHREHMEAVYRGLFDALVDALARHFTRATDRAQEPGSHRRQRSLHR